MSIPLETLLFLSHARKTRLLAEKAIRKLIRQAYLPEARILWEDNLRRLKRKKNVRDFIHAYEQLSRFITLAEHGSIHPLSEDVFITYHATERETLSMKDLDTLRLTASMILTLTD